MITKEKDEKKKKKKKRYSSSIYLKSSLQREEVAT